MSTIDMGNIEVEIMIEMRREDRTPFEAIRYQVCYKSKML